MVTLTVSSPSISRSATEVSTRLYDSAPAGITKDPGRATKSVPDVAVPVTVYDTVLAFETGLLKANAKVPVPAAPGPPSGMTVVAALTLAVELSSLSMVYTELTTGPAATVTNVFMLTLTVSSGSTVRSP